MPRKPQIRANTQADPLERLARLWSLERRATRERFVAERSELPLGERVAMGLALRDLRVDETSAAAGGRLLLWLTSGRPADLTQLRIGPGDPVRLWWQDPEEAEALRGVFTRRRGERIGVVVPDRDEVLDLLDGSGFRLDRDEPMATFDRGDKALAQFRAAASGSDIGRLRDQLFGTRDGRAEPWSGSFHDLPRKDKPEREDAAGAGPASGAGGDGPSSPPPKSQLSHQVLPPLTLRDAGLNAAQRAAVARGLAAPTVALIHGPPGTGKTRTLVELAWQAAQRGERILATAASNAAVDNLAERMLEAGLELVRLGHPARVSPAIEPFTLDALAEAEPGYALAKGWMAEADRIRRRSSSRAERGGYDRSARREAQAEANGLSRDARRQLQQLQALVLDRATVVCATAAGSDSGLLGAQRFDLVIVDEASQAVDPIILVPLVRGRRAVMAGDHRQLPPTVIDPEAASKGLGRTIFERLAEAEEGGAAHPSSPVDEGRAGPAGPKSLDAPRNAGLVSRLTVQHRMHRSLMAFPSDSMYEGRLVAAPAVAEHRIEDLPGVQADPLRPGPLVYIDTAGKGWDERRGSADPSTSNPEQALRVAAELRRLLARGLHASDAAIITPYRAQARLLRELLAGEHAAGLEIDTVDGFQGREKEAILVDLVRANPEGQIGFLSDTRRMNVALTRARRFLLVVGDSATIGAHPYYAAFIAAAEAAGGWISAWADDADPLI